MTRLLKKISVFTLICAVLAFTIASCKKEEKPNAEVQATLDQVTLMLQTNNSLVRSSVLTGQGNQEKAGGFTTNTVEDRCGAVTSVPADPLGFPKTLTFDYGSGCTDALGVQRAGSYAVKLGKLWEAGTSSSIAYSDYSENGVKMNGSLTLSNTSAPTGFGFGLTATNLKRTETTGATSTVESALLFKQTQGYITFWDWNDDVYEVTGTSQYALANGETGAFAITVPLNKANNCAWFSKGSGTVTLNGQTYAIDFGNGTCDNEATVTIGGASYTIYL